MDCFFRRNLLDALPQLVSAFEVDRLFKRTFINAIPIWELHKFVSFKTFHICDICVALVNFLSRENVSTTKVRNLIGENSTVEVAAAQVLAKWQNTCKASKCECLFYFIFSEFS